MFFLINKNEDDLLLPSRCSSVYEETATEMADKGSPSSSTFSVPSTVLSTLCVLTHLIPTTILGGLYCHHDLLIDVETETQRG